MNPIRKFAHATALFSLLSFIPSIQVASADSNTVDQFYKTAGKLRARAIYFYERSQAFSAYRRNLEDLNESLSATSEANEDLISQLSGKKELSPEERDTLASLKYSQVENRNIIAAREKEIESTKSQLREYFKSREKAQDKFSEYWSSLGQNAPCTATAPQYIELVRQLDLILQKDGSPQDVDLSASEGLRSLFEKRTDYFREKVRKVLDEENQLREKLMELQAKEASLNTELNRPDAEMGSKLRSEMSLQLKRVQDRFSRIKDAELDASSMIDKNIHGLEEASRMELILSRIHQAVHIPTYRGCAAVTDAAVAPGRDVPLPGPDSSGTVSAVTTQVAE